MSSSEIAKQSEFLSDLSRAFSGTLDHDSILESILESLNTNMKFERGTVTLLDPVTENLVIKTAHGISEKSRKQVSYKVGEGITGTVFETGKEIIVPDIRKDPRFLHKTGARDTKNKRISFYCVPIKLGTQTIGTLSVDRQAEPKEKYKENLRLLQLIATMIALSEQVNRLVKIESQSLRNENLQLREELKKKFSIHNMVGTSNSMKQVYRLIDQVAQSNATVLIRGESGTGKDLVAHAIHYNSPRSTKPFIKVNCMALPDTLLESELFGHEKGAFTGATERKIGRFELAHGGTIFLDEIGDFSLDLQVKMLRVIQFKEFERLGGRETIKCNVRVIVATNKDLEKEIKNGLFREDLYYRINVFPIFLPPLRERKDDIMLLADYFLEKYAKENIKDIHRISTPAIEMLTSYHWPGNIRELENCMERAVLICDGDVLRSEHLPPSLQMAHGKESAQKMSMDEIIENKEKELIIDALKRVGGLQRKTAAELGITERILGYKIKKYKILPKYFS
jgi:Nif-specific regulatory protein